MSEEKSMVNKYKIGDKDFILRDLSLDQADEVNRLLLPMKGEGNHLEVKFTLKENNRLLSLILEPSDLQEVPEEFFGKCKESVSVEILKDFFLKRLMMRNNSMNFFTNLMQKQK